MTMILTTEAGDRLVAESVAGFTGASSLNDTSGFSLSKETFTTNPTLRGWIIGVNWSWNAGNGNIEPI